MNIKKIFFTFFTLITILSLQLIFTGTIADAKENTVEAIDGSTLSKSELDVIRENGDYILDLTYEQALERAAEVSGKPIEEIKKSYISNKSYTSNKLRANPSGCTWKETSTTLTVKSYKPQLIVIVEACRNGSFGWITNKKPLLQEFKAGSKKFDGSIKVDLNGTGYHYVVNGTFYNYGTVTHTGTTGANSVFTATYSVSSANNMYGTIYTGLKRRDIIR